MMVLSFVLAAGATVTLLLAGYLFGARRGRAARAAIAGERDSMSARVGELEAQLAPMAASMALAETRKAPDVDGLRRELQHLATAVSARDRTNESLREEIRGLLTTSQKQAPAPEQVSRDVQRALAPLLDRERLGRELAQIRVGTGGLAELPRLLDAIADRACFASVVLSDEVGLPLAASSTASDVEMLAGTASFFLTLAEREERADHPTPLACVVLDATNRVTVHRMFKVGEARFTLSAVSRGANVAPGALDAALTPLEHVLGRKDEVA